MKKELSTNEIENIIESSLLIENTENEISITFPAKRMRERLSEEQIQEFLDELCPVIYQSLRLKI